MVKATKEVKEYFSRLQKDLDRAYKIAQKVREKGLDPTKEVETTFAQDVAGRVEGLIGPEGIAEEIRERERGGMLRTIIAYEIVKKIVNENKDTVSEREKENEKKNLEKAIDQAVRTGVAILTEGVLVAPTEGIGRLKIKENPDGSNYLSIYFSGPIRSAGGTVASLSVVLADVARREAGIKDYRPTDTEVERYIEEINLYHARCARLQYMPSEEEIRIIVKNCPVCIDGDPTSRLEVSVHKHMERVGTNRIRGGMALVIGEGIAQKAPKVLKYTRKIGLDWDWLESIIKVKSTDKGTVGIKPIKTYLGEIVAGRPIFAYPMRKGGFRLRYGRTRITGIMAKALHPATMEVMDEFPAIGTQLKIERPGKGCVVMPCDTIEPPIVKLKNGDVIKIKTIEQAKEIKKDIIEILFLGDMLITIGDFIKANHPLIPSGYCEEWWEAECKAKNLKTKEMDAYEAFNFSEKHDIPLHPNFTYFWGDIDIDELKELVYWLKNADVHFDLFGRIKSCKIPLTIPVQKEDEEKRKNNAKRVLEELGVLHKVEESDGSKDVVLEPDEAFALFTTLGMIDNKEINTKRFDKLWNENADNENNKKNGKPNKGENAEKDKSKGADKSEDKNTDKKVADKTVLDKNVLEIVNELAGIKIKNKAPYYIGARMGRPEKAKEREMKPPINVLFPLGQLSKHRDIIKTYQYLKDQQIRGDKGIKVDIARRVCPECGKISFYTQCSCGAETEIENTCSKCGRVIKEGDICQCGGKIKAFDTRAINIVSMLDDIKNTCGGYLPDKIKGVKGLINSSKIPERLEKGVFRAKHNISCFKDGTSRFDFTDATITHFKPREIGITIEQAKKLGYKKDYLGNELTDENQIVEIFPQDIIISEKGFDFFKRMADFIDDTLVYLYNMKPFYNIKNQDEIIGKLVVVQSPHTSAGVLSRIIGSTKARVSYMHPYLICGTRRNCDGDENCFMVLMDVLINFSRKYLPESRGGTMDIPIILTTILNPKEVDDEVHVMEIIDRIPLEFYEATERFESPSNTKIKLVADILEKPEQYNNLNFTHNTSDINKGPKRTTYIQFKSMKEKVNAQFDLHQKIRAVDIKDAAERLILSHFIPDLYGNLRKFSQQTFRCVHCNAKYRRMPLIGKCRKCGGRLILTVYQGGITKYLDISKEMTEKYDLPLYLKQRLDLLEKDIQSIFIDEKAPQVSLSEFM